MRKKPYAFTLVEVVLALGLVTFAMMALLGLMTSALSIDQRSGEEIQASSIAGVILEGRKMRPADEDESLVLPTVSGQSGQTSALIKENFGSPVYLAETGGTAAKEVAHYALRYRVETHPPGSGIPATVYLMISWPAQQNPPQSYYEVISSVVAP